MTKYVIGIDFGTLSGRSVMVDVSNGFEFAEAVHSYQHGVIEDQLPGTNVFLKPNWALQDPNDYIAVVKTTIPKLIHQTGVNPSDIIGIGVDFTASTILPVKKDGTPLCFLLEWRENPHAWVKLWKHHSTQPEADQMTRIAEENGYSFLQRYGSKVSPEWFFPKVLQTLREAPEVYHAADRFIEAGDWIVWLLTGMEKRSACAAGYKSFWAKRDGFPDDAFFELLNGDLEHVVDEKMGHDVHPIGTRAGNLTPQAAEWTDLLPGTPVAVANVDAHAAVPAVGAVQPGEMVIIMGTSNCHMVCCETEHNVPGICGYVEDGILPGFFGYEAGQTCVGDLFMWFIENWVPASYTEAAVNEGKDIHTYLTEKALLLKPGESGLMALDWWNGNRSVLVDADLTGMIMGLTLATRPEEVYRALLEATAYGTRKIIETLELHGIPVNSIVAAGGLPGKNPLLMQIYADVTGREIKVTRTRQSGALGSAIMGAVAAGKAAGGYATITDACKKMASLSEKMYLPDPTAQTMYDRLYADFVWLHDTFGRENGALILKHLKSIRSQVKAVNE